MHRNRRTVARLSRSPPPTELIALPPRRVLRLILLRMPPGRCKVLFAMCPAQADTLTRQAPTPRLDLISVLPQQRITVTVAPATVTNPLQGHLMASHQMWHIGRARVQAPWVSLGRLGLLILLHNCNTVIHHHLTSTCIHPSDSFSMDRFRSSFLRTFLAFFSFCFLSSDRAG